MADDLLYPPVIRTVEIVTKDWTDWADVLHRLIGDPKVIDVNLIYDR